MVVQRLDELIPLVLPPLSTGFRTLLVVEPVLVGRETPVEVSAHITVRPTGRGDDEVVVDLIEAEAPTVGEVAPTHMFSRPASSGGVGPERRSGTQRRLTVHVGIEESIKKSHVKSGGKRGVCMCVCVERSLLNRPSGVNPVPLVRPSPGS